MDTPVENPKSDTERLTYLNITFSDKGVAEFSENICVVFIPREEIQRISRKVGFRAERPLVQGLGGGLLAALGLCGVYLFIVGGFELLRWELGFLVFGALGVWLLWEALRKGHYLLVVCNKENRKLGFDGKVSEAELEVFLRNAARFGYICE